MNLYERIKASVTPKDAAERYGLIVNRNGMAHCPFHPDKHPSMKLYDDHFYCFNCHAAGDVIDLTAKIFGFSNQDAARKLAADYGIDPTQPPVALRLRKPREQNIEKLCRRFLTEYFQLLKEISSFTNGFYGIVVLGNVNRMCGTVGYFTISTKIPHNRKIGRSIHEQDIAPEKWSRFCQTTILHKTAKRMHQQVYTLRCFYINKNGGFKK